MKRRSISNGYVAWPLQLGIYKIQTMFSVQTYGAGENSQN